MAIQPLGAGPEKENRFYGIKGIDSEALEEFREKLPLLEEGDFIIGGRLREDFKPFVYSGLVSEFPMNGESVFVVTERGEEVSYSHGLKNERDILESSPEIGMGEAYKVFDPTSESFAQVEICEELLGRYRAEREQKVKNEDREAWKRYVDLGSEILSKWEEVYHRTSNQDSGDIGEYNSLLEERLEELTGELLELAETRTGQQVESVRNAIYEMERISDYLEE